VRPWCVCVFVRCLALLRSPPRSREASPGHEQEAVSLLLQVVFCLFAHSSVPVMMRVYGGEWRHGGYSNQLFSRVFRGEFERHDCTWFSFTYGVDLMLRWT
ncbi:unnamed protein product, partial [Prorocentrum cordatum]